jgi:indole-3-glycerol phosphate synthase
MGRFNDSLRAAGLGAIAEVKRRSPSAGELRPEADPGALAAAFERAGASAVSILVDERFGGSTADLAAARSASRVPLLAKGFFSREEQLAEMRRAGADAVLLILRDLDDARARGLMASAKELGLDTLVEAHDEAEIDRALALDSPVVGVNARDLDTLEVDRDRQLELLGRLPADVVRVAESGIGSRDAVVEARDAGADAVLVGTALMRDPALLGSLAAVERR